MYMCAYDAGAAGRGGASLLRGAGRGPARRPIVIIIIIIYIYIYNLGATVRAHSADSMSILRARATLADCKGYPVKIHL